MKADQTDQSIPGPALSPVPECLFGQATGGQSTQPFSSDIGLRTHSQSGPKSVHSSFRREHAMPATVGVLFRQEVRPEHRFVCRPLHCPPAGAAPGFTHRVAKAGVEPQGVAAAHNESACAKQPFRNQCTHFTSRQKTRISPTRPIQYSSAKPFSVRLHTLVHSSPSRR